MGWNERSDPDMRTANFCDVYREGVYRGRSHIAPKNAWKTLGALLSPFFPKRSGVCAPEAFVVAKQPSAALSVTRRCGALAAF